jgi:hypothetical protein
MRASASVDDSSHRECATRGEVLANPSRHAQRDDDDDDDDDGDGDARARVRARRSLGVRHGRGASTSGSTAARRGALLGTTTRCDDDVRGEEKRA